MLRKGPLLPNYIPTSYLTKYTWRPRPLATSREAVCSRGHRLILFLVFRCAGPWATLMSLAAGLSVSVVYSHTSVGSAEVRRLFFRGIP